VFPYRQRPFFEAIFRHSSSEFVDIKEGYDDRNYGNIGKKPAFVRVWHTWLQKFSIMTAFLALFGVKGASPLSRMKVTKVSDSAAVCIWDSIPFKLFCGVLAGMKMP